MLQHEEIVKQFTWGISILTAYLRYNNKINYTDINILSEGFVGDLLNILYEFDVKKSKQQNAPGYDLISKHKKVIVQVSTTCTPEKVKHTFSTIINLMSKRKTLETKLKELDKEKKANDQIIKKQKEMLQQEISNIIDFRGYTIIFFFLCENADPIIKYGQKGNLTFEPPAELHFCQKSDVLCFDSLVQAVNNISQATETKKIERLKDFMVRNANLFIRRVNIQSNKVTQIINEYTENFVQPLFLHRYQPRTRVTLKNLFVEPSLLDINAETTSNYSGNIITLLDSFVWGSNKDRLLFIDGDAAIGKTSLISWLCYHYSNLDDVGKSVFCNMQLVCVRLRDLIIGENESAESCILRYLSFNNMEEFKEQYNNALIILEGADELGLIGGIGSLTIEQFILNVRHAFSSHKIVITSRPKFINMNFFSGSTQTFTYQHYSLNHFSKEKRNCWINNYEQTNKCGEFIPQSTKRYLSEITDDEASGVADTPLALYLLASCEITAKLKSNRWALYREIFHNAIRNTPYNESFNGNGSIPYHRALKEDDFAESVYITITKIANKMFENTKEDRFYISGTELDEIIFKTKTADKDEKLKAIRKCCVLCAYWKENTNTGALEFYHNNIRDFFMCEYIYERFLNTTYSSNPNEIISQLIETACEIFQFGMIAQTTWAQSFSFFYFRLRFEKDSKESVAKKLKIYELFPSIIHAMINDVTMWRYRYYGLQYESIKSTFLNFALFLRVWIAAETCTLLETFSAQANYNFWHGKGVFEDWITIFTNTIDITDNKHIAFGSQTKFSNMDFKQASLERVCFEESEFVNSTFESSALGYANFTGATLNSVNFSGADLHDADFSNATLIGIDFSMSTLHNAKFVNATIKDVIWPDKASCLKDANFSSAYIQNANWKNWKLNSIEFNATKFENCSFHRIQFFSSVSNAEFNSCSITNTSFESVHNLVFNKQKAEISEISFHENIDECLFSNLTINGSNWTNAFIDKTKFIDVHMINTEFISTAIKDITFEHCIMDSVNVYKAHLSSPVATYLKTHAKKILSFKTAKIYAEDISEGS